MGPKLVDYLTYEPEDSGILWIKFNRPDRLNALVGTAEENGTVAKVGEYMRAGDDDPNVRVIILTGVGRGFCSGANLASRENPGENFVGNRSPHEGLDGTRQHFYHGFTKLHRDISLIRKPTIAMINGPAVGSGMDMALHCDIRIGWYSLKFDCIARPALKVISQFIRWVMPSMTAPCDWFIAALGLTIWRPMSAATHTLFTLMRFCASTEISATCAK